jgi:predicted DCC family thiol-disulfide oxidoreductase YuxK
MEHSQQIIFYDGECGFCNFIVGFILKNEKKPMFHFAALQSNLAHEILIDQHQLSINFDTFYYLNNDQIFTKSKGFFELAKHLKYPVRALRIFRFIPVFLTDKVYDLIAKRRKKIMTEKCYLPTAEERKRFLN